MTPRLRRKTNPTQLFVIAREWQNEKLDWETGAGRSYLLPAGEILLYEFLLNLFDRNFVEPKSDYQTNGRHDLEKSHRFEVGHR